MSRYPKARPVPARNVDGSLRPGVPWVKNLDPFKVIHHKTVGTSENAAGLYTKTGSWPNYTVGDSGVQEHYDTDIGSRALMNTPGGVETNADHAIQIEVVGVPGETMSTATMTNLVGLLKWLEHTLAIKWVWPMGRPPKDSKTGYGAANGHRDPKVWRTKGGHYGHSQVPENEHWDPAYTDDEWAGLNRAMS